jgi:hypothetical protein
MRGNCVELKQRTLFVPLSNSFPGNKVGGEREEGRNGLSRISVMLPYDSKVSVNYNYRALLEHFCQRNVSEIIVHVRARDGCIMHVRVLIIIISRICK